MARKTKKNDGKRKKRAFGDGITFVMNNLSETQLEEFDGMAKDHAKMIAFMFENIVDRGLDFKLSWDDYHGCYQTSATGAWEGFPVSGYAITARSDTAHDAIAMLAYKLCVVAEFNLEAWAKDKDNRPTRG